MVPDHGFYPGIEAICGVPAAPIRDLAVRFAGARTMLAANWSIQCQHHGEQTHRMLVTLVAMLGQIGLPGGGFGLSYHDASGGSPSADSPVLPGITDGGKAVEGAAWLTESGAASIPVSRIVEMLERQGEEFDVNGTRATFPAVKLAYWLGGNPFAHHQDRNRMVRAGEKLEAVIVHDCQWTATARHADIALLATTPYERNDIEQVGDYSLKAIVAMKKIIEPVCGTILRETYAVASREPCLISSEDAAARGIGSGGRVRIVNDRDQTPAGAIVTDDIRAGAIQMVEGGWYAPQHGAPGAPDLYGDVNVLTVDRGTSSLAQGNCGHTGVVEVENYTGEAPLPYVFEAPPDA